jgi:hypothetical protein
MRTVRYYPTGGGPRRGTQRRGKLYRGSRHRIRRLKWHEHTSIEFWVVVAFILFVLFFGIPWLIKHPIDLHHRKPSGPAAHA